MWYVCDILVVMHFVNGVNQVECFDYDSDGDHDLIGGFTTTVAEMLQAASKPVCLCYCCALI